MSYNFTAEQLLELYQTPGKGRGWFLTKKTGQANSTLDLSNIVALPAASVDENGYWKFHLSIVPQQMSQAIPIVHKHFSAYAGPIAMKMASQDLLTHDHQSGKQFAIIFNKLQENSTLGQKKIILFLAELAYDLQKAGIRPEQRHMLTHETEQELERISHPTDISNMAMGKYDAKIKWQEGEQFSYFNYRAEFPVLLTHVSYLAEDPNGSEFSRMVDGSTVKNMEACYKHNPLRAADPFYHLVLHQRVLMASKDKQDFLTDLKFKLENQCLSRADILDLFTDIKNPQGPYAFIHAQRHPSFDRFRLWFKSTVKGQNEQHFWHTKTYQTAVKMLKNAYLNAQGELLEARKEDERAFIDYVRGNSVMHFSSTSTRALLGR